MPARETLIETIHGELNLLGRRVRTLAHRLHPELSFVAYSLLSRVSATGGCRAADLAGAYGLDKSTVSRQVADLERRGLLRRDAGGDRLLHITGHGREVLAAAAGRERAALAARMADWPARDLAVFADLLGRFNHSEPERAP